uniref:hypothetical protein n=1 Tax=Flavobacterium sp. TaxID=239 RepID=UPI004047C5E1
MANFLECTERTTYRYIDLLKQLGFEVQKDEHNKFFILSDKETDDFPEKIYPLEEKLQLKVGAQVMFIK